MKHFAVIGSPIAHSLSPLLHNEIFRMKNKNAVYSAVHMPPEKLEKEFKRLVADFDGFNCTIPLKQQILPYLSQVSSSAAALGSVNTVKIDGEKTFGSSTDAEGFLRSLAKHNINIAKDDKVLIIGAGGVARVIAHACAEKGAKLTFAVRNKEKAKALAAETEKLTGAKTAVCGLDEIKGKFRLIVQCTPVGMYPNPDACPVSDEVIACGEAVFDTIYTPLKTKFIKKAEKLGKKAVGGLEMLVFQGLASEEIWNGPTFDSGDEIHLLKTLEWALDFSPKKNIALIGFMASGKSSLGKVLAQELRFNFVDTDYEIEKAEGRKISEIFDVNGEEYFRKAETETLKRFSHGDRLVLSTGGGIISSPENAELLKREFITVFLDVPFETLKMRAERSCERPLFRDVTAAKELYDRRYPLYKKAADFAITPSEGLVKAVGEIEEKLKIEN